MYNRAGLQILCLRYRVLKLTTEKGNMHILNIIISKSEYTYCLDKYIFLIQNTTFELDIISRIFRPV